MACDFSERDRQWLQKHSIPLVNAAWKPGSCLVCRRTFSIAEFAYQQIGVCSYCAEAIANTFSLAHGGAYLTWENAPALTLSGARKDKIPIELKARVFARDKFGCLKCGAESSLSCDHIIPESKGGQTTFENLQTLCSPCNRRKGTKSNAEFMGGKAA